MKVMVVICGGTGNRSVSLKFGIQLVWRRLNRKQVLTSAAKLWAYAKAQ